MPRAVHHPHKLYQGNRVDFQDILVEQHNILIISEHKTDHLILSACLERARPERFKLVSAESIERPLEALMAPDVDAVIMAHGAQTEYLLRLAQKNNVSEHREYHTHTHTHTHLSWLKV